MSGSDDNIVLFRRAPAELNRRNLERFARILRDEVARGAGFTCLIAGDAELRRLNRDFLGKDYPTDVLSFPVGQASRPVLFRHLGESGHLGEIAISAARARAQAAAFGHPLENEIRILMLHGLLHLLGMDHETDRGQMARAEARWRQRLALPAGPLGRNTTPAPGPRPLAPARKARHVAPARKARHEARA
jgi:probable rRNA maturation factor